MTSDTGDRDYYRTGDIECIDALKAALGREGFIAFLRGQVIKYNWRLGRKVNDHEDSIKAAWYQNRLTKELEDVGDVRFTNYTFSENAGDSGGSARG